MNTCTNNTNNSTCSCTYEPCPRKGRCCECVSYHRRQGEVPGCLFSKDAERSHDRSIWHFIKTHSGPQR